MSVDASDFFSLSRDLSAASRELVPVARQIIQKGVQDIKRDAQLGSPVDTGFLRSSITYETRVLSTSVVGEVGPTAEYGAFVEYGTSRSGPQPYMGPAFARNAPYIEAALDQAIARLL